MSDPSAVDPEEAFVAALSSCHMLWFLSIAAKGGFIVEKYEDQATGKMEKDNNGTLAITEVTLYPHVTFHPDSAPTEKEAADMHHQAHKKCFIANSVKTEVKIDSNMEVAVAE